MGTIDPKYTTSVSVTGGRQGHAVSDDGVLDLQLRTPKINGVSEGTNPEQLFAAAWAGCFGGALGGAGRSAGVDTSEATVKVEVSMGPDSDGGYGLAATIFVSIPGVETGQVQALAESAHEACPYSKATRGNVAVEVTAI
jgi:Ohr subfamily peroxiredoxin